jgi:hypothetical protein
MNANEGIPVESVSAANPGAVDPCGFGLRREAGRARAQWDRAIPPREPPTTRVGSGFPAAPRPPAASSRLGDEARDLLAAKTLDPRGDVTHSLAQDGQLFGGDAVLHAVPRLDVRTLQ